MRGQVCKVIKRSGPGNSDSLHTDSEALLQDLLVHRQVGYDAPQPCILIFKLLELA